MLQLFEAASWSFSCNNAQPWVYIYAHRDDEKAFKKLFNCLDGGNQQWAGEAAVLAVCIANTVFENGKPNRWAYHDLGAANMNMITEATANCIFGHFMAGFDADKLKKEYGLPETYEPVAMLAMGYLGDAEDLKEPFKTRELTVRTRKPASEFAFKNKLS